MRPLLASIALLLLALCRQSSAGRPRITVESIKRESSSSSVSIISSPKASNVEENAKHPMGVDVDSAAITKLLDAMPNFFISVLLGDAFKELPDFLKKAFSYGMLCEADDANLKQTILSAMFPGGYNEAEHTKETAELAKLTGPAKMNCAAPATLEEICFCTEKKPLLFCITVMLKRAANAEGKTKPALCRDDALAALKQTGSTELGKLYDAEEVKDDSFKDLFSNEAAGIEAITKAEDKMTKVFCDAIDPNVEKAVIALYNNDGMYWIAEGLVYTILFGPARRDLPTACKDSAFSETKYGQCVCKAMSGQGTGFSFCIYKVLAEYFKEIGFLNCDTKKFEAAKKPSALPSVLPKAAGGSSSSSSSGSASATTFSLLAPAAAAAALLLRQ